MLLIAAALRRLSPVSMIVEYPARLVAQSRPSHHYARYLCQAIRPITLVACS
ncbi:hypothetical protein O9992_15535 [Vibrio lentus]|nr:hypothetical protein [Vibrio lentus]